MHTQSSHLSIPARLRGFAHDHDDLPAFHAAFLVWTFLAAAIFNLGCFLLLILFHVSLDYVKYREIHACGRWQSLLASCRESLVDLMLFSVALASVVYTEHVFAMELWSGLLRAEASIVRFAATMVAKIHILEHTFHLIAHMSHYLHHADHEPRRALDAVEKLYLTFLVAGITLIVCAPFVLRMSGLALEHILLRELIPGMS